MKKIIDPFIDFLPSIDLHGMDRVCARIKTEEFINDSIKLKNKNVINFKLNVPNIGSTTVDLKID